MFKCTWEILQVLNTTFSGIWSTQVMIGCYTRLQVPLICGFEVMSWKRFILIRSSARIKQWAEPSWAQVAYSLPWVVFISSWCLKGQWAQPRGATRVPHLDRMAWHMKWLSQLFLSSQNSSNLPLTTLLSHISAAGLLGLFLLTVTHNQLTF